MRDWEALRKRYQKDPIAVRLGGLAANLARIRSFSQKPENQKAVEGLLEESEFFIEWAAPDTHLETQLELIELQRLLARWHLSWQRLWPNPAERAQVASQAKTWSDRILQWSGLIVASNENKEIQ